MGKREKEALIIIALLIMLYICSGSPLVSWLGYYGYKIFIEGGIYFGICIWIWYKPRQRPEAKLKFQQDIVIWAILISIVYLLTIFLAGVVTGFGNNIYDISLKGITSNLLTIISIGLMQQWIKHYVVHRVKKKYRIMILVGLTVFFVISRFRLEQLITFNGLEGAITFYSSYVLPNLAIEALLSYFVYIGGFTPSGIIYLATSLPFYVLPVVPNLNWLTHLLVKTLVPVFGMMFIHEYYQSKAKLIKKREKPKEGAFGWLITSLVSIMMVWFVVGVFPVFPAVVLTGSMEPLVYPGDVVLVEKKIYDEVELNDVLYFQSEEVYIIHRVIDLEGDTFRTKGDNNNSPDSDLVKAEDVRGVMVGKIPYIGRISLWMRGNSIDVEDYEN